jgi:hypothetical protein
MTNTDQIVLTGSQKDDKQIGSFQQINSAMTVFPKYVFQRQLFHVLYS